MKEHEIQNSIREALMRRGYLVVRQNVGEGWTGNAVTTGTNEIKIFSPRRFSTGLPRGWPDLMVIGVDGTVGFIEVKTASGKLSRFQYVMIDQLISRGCRAGVARSPEDAIRIMEG